MLFFWGGILTVPLNNQLWCGEVSRKGQLLCLTKFPSTVGGAWGWRPYPFGWRCHNGPPLPYIYCLYSVMWSDIYNPLNNGFCCHGHNFSCIYRFDQYPLIHAWDLMSENKSLCYLKQITQKAEALKHRPDLMTPPTPEFEGLCNFLCSPVPDTDLSVCDSCCFACWKKIPSVVRQVWSGVSCRRGSLSSFISIEVVMWRQHEKLRPEMNGGQACARARQNTCTFLSPHQADGHNEDKTGTQTVPSK